MKSIHQPIVTALMLSIGIGAAPSWAAPRGPANKRSPLLPSPAKTTAPAACDPTISSCTPTDSIAPEVAQGLPAEPNPMIDERGCNWANSSCGDPMEEFIVSASELPPNKIDSNKHPLPFVARSIRGGPPAAAQCSQADWQYGYRQALAGQRFIVGTSIDVAPTDPLSPTNPDRKACADYRKKGAEAVRCCMVGFGRGTLVLQELISKMDQQSKRDPPPKLSGQERLCLHEYKIGRSMAKAYCDEVANLSCEPKAMPPIRYLGCYHVGFFSNFLSCPHGETVRKVAEYLRTNLHGIFDQSRNKGDTVTDPRESRKPAAGRAQ